MGLFQHRPEEPTEWGGLPSEPWEPREPAERLGDAPPIDIDLFGEGVHGATVSFTLADVEPMSPDLSGADGADGD